MKSYENKFSDCKKDSDGFTKIRVRFYDNAEYVCVLAKPVPMTDPYYKRLFDALGPDEVKRLNFTVWAIKRIPEHEDLYFGDIDGEWCMYFNGAERAWKFYDEYPSLSDDGMDDDIVQQLAAEEPWFEPHNDEAGNYGDEDVHAVYDI